MVPRKVPPVPPLVNPTLRVLEPATRCEMGAEVNGETSAIVFASADRVMESARRMLRIHQATFRKLAE